VDSQAAPWSPYGRRLVCVTHYVIKRCDPAKLGATKLNKVLWFADVIY
jgi:hypothetical protein